MTTVGVPRHIWDSDFLDRFYDGWTRIATHYGVELIGGDISRTPDKIVIDSIVGGDVPKGKAILRSGARESSS
jgi:thiamine-monophosphate kinase